mmetsp:Transcript_1842/g.2481  ORF Transcript_1842/g.2481 Transcript_1842/m.2481 type:complete len:153 (+) Transcript_1842:53-511(+)
MPNNVCLWTSAFHKTTIVTMSAVSFCLLVFLVIVDLAHANNPCGRRFYTTYVTTQTYNDITCTPQEEQEIATMMEGAMDHELKSMGYKMYENIICDNAIVDNRRQLESQNSSESEVQPYLNQTIEGRSRQLGYNFGYQGKLRSQLNCSHFIR